MVPHHSSTDLFWGDIDANMDWCESNYVVTEYVAEFWNTLSSLPMVFLGLFGCVYTARHATGEKRFQLAFLALALVGLGSTMFHATLRRYAQLLDEIPMLIANHIFIFIQREAAAKGHSSATWTLALTLVASLTTMTTLYVVFEWYWIFILGYTAGICAMWAFLIPRLRTLKPAQWRIFVITVTTWYGGFAFWLLEHVYCQDVEAWQFHAIWHLGAGYGTYMWILFLLWARGEATLGAHAPSLHQSGVGVHFVKYKDGSHNA